jgi:hypothetical protein
MSLNRCLCPFIFTCILLQSYYSQNMNLHFYHDLLFEAKF